MFKRLNYQLDDELLITPSVAITVCTKSSFFDIREGVLDFYSQSLDILGSTLRWFRTETMLHFRPISLRTFKMIPFWFEPQARRRSFYVMTLKGGKSSTDITPEGINLAFLTHSGGQLRLSLPVEYIQESAESLLLLTKKLVRKFPFKWGQAGYCLSVDTFNMTDEVKKQLVARSRRYPGIDIPNDSGGPRYETEGIKCLNWLTLLDNELYGKLADKAKELTNRNKQILIHQIDQGVIIQAGPTPEIGDINKGESLPNYHDVGRLVSTLRVKDYSALLGTKDETLKWLSRFDQ